MDLFMVKTVYRSLVIIELLQHKNYTYLSQFFLKINNFAHLCRCITFCSKKLCDRRHVMYINIHHLQGENKQMAESRESIAP